MAEIETTRDARQGRKGTRVLYVLIAAIALAVVAGVGVLTWQGSKAPVDRSAQTQQSAHDTATGEKSPDPVQTQSPGNANTPAEKAR